MKNISRTYPYLVCGLPDLSFEMDISEAQIEEIKSQIREIVSQHDLLYIDLLDSPNLFNDFLTELFAREKESQEEVLRGEDPVWKSFPGYLQKWGENYYREVSEEGEPENKDAQRPCYMAQLLQNYYKEGLQTENPFLKRWFAFDLELNNIKVAYVARKMEKEAWNDFVIPDPKVLEDDENFYNWLKKYAMVSDFNLKFWVSYSEELFSILDKEDLLEREKSLDLFRWNKIEEFSMDYSFDISAVLAYLLKLQIVERWQNLDLQEGKELLQAMVQKLRNVTIAE